MAKARRQREGTPFEELPTGRIPAVREQPALDGSQDTVALEPAAVPAAAGVPEGRAAAADDPAAAPASDPSQSSQITVPLEPVGTPQGGEGEAVDAQDGPDEEAAASAEGEVPEEEGAPQPAPKRRRRRVRTWHVVTALIMLLIAALVAAFAYFAWDRWYRYDDAADIQGTWYVAGTDVPVTISGDTIRFTEDMAYGYALDASQKTLSFNLGHLSGESRYWFADDRQLLVIVDGTGYSQWGTASDDLMRDLRELSDISAGLGVHPPQDDDLVALARTPFYGGAAADEGEEGGDAADTGASEGSPAADDGQDARAQEGSPEGDGASGGAGDDVFGSISDRA